MSSMKHVFATFFGCAWVGLMTSTQLFGQSVTPAPALQMLPMVSDTYIAPSTPSVPSTLLVTSDLSKPFHLRAGDSRRVLGRAEITSSTER